MKVKDLQYVVRQLSTESSVLSHTGSVEWEAFQNFVQRRKAENHFHAAAGASVTSSLQAEVKGLQASLDGSGEGGGCMSSLDFLRRHATCLALVVGWVDTKQAAASAVAKNSSTDIRGSGVVNAGSSQQELSALVMTLLSLITVDLMAVMDLSTTAERTGQSMFQG
jgi:hypothetical protein